MPKQIFLLHQDLSWLWQIPNKNIIENQNECSDVETDTKKMTQIPMTDKFKEITILEPEERDKPETKEKTPPSVNLFHVHAVFIEKETGWDIEARLSVEEISQKTQQSSNTGSNESTETFDPD